MRFIRSCVLCALTLCLQVSAHAEGLIYQLPDDATWVRFKVSGKGIAPDGTVTVTVEGTQTLVNFMAEFQRKNG